MLIPHTNPKLLLDDGNANERKRERERKKLLLLMLLLLLLTSDMASECELDAHDLSTVYILDGKATRTIRQILTTSINWNLYK